MIFSNDFRGEFLWEEKGFLISLILSLTNGNPLLSGFEHSDSIPITVITIFLFISFLLT